MSELPRERPLLPIACTLDADTGPQRLGEWQAILADLEQRETRPGSIVLHFRDQPGLGAELTRLANAESVCCSFLDWAVQERPNGWRVVISGDEATLATLPTGL